MHPNLSPSGEPSTAPERNRNEWHPTTFTCFAACLTGCLLGTILIHAVDPFFDLQYTKELGISPPPEEIQKYRSAIQQYWVNNYTLDFAMLGGALGMCIGFISTLSRRIPSTAAGCIAGVLLGACSANISSGFVVQAILANSDQSLLLAVGLQGSIWGSVFGAIVFAVASIQSDIKSAANGLCFGMAFGFLSVIGYLIIFSFAFTGADLTHLIPMTFLERIVWAMIESVILGIGLYFITHSISSRGNQRSIASQTSYIRI
ncbi:MAG: hypothetical protein KGQ60_06000 [Planctomycetes bacterium]|nr:hypothetical protein [Planctomycetota bacterium]